ncbi:MAG: DNA polymerase domain-containing protein [Methanomassiliicoccales archaeon]
MRGWILDCYPDHEHDCIVIWLKTASGVEKLIDRHFRPSFYVRSCCEGLRKVEEGLRMLGVEDLEMEMRTTLMDPRPRPSLRVTVDEYRQLEQLVRLVDMWGHYHEHELYNVDLRFDQRYYLEKGIFPMGLVEVGTEYRMLDAQESLHYPIPPLSAVQIGVRIQAARGIPTHEDPLLSVRVNEDVLDGPEDDILERLLEMIESMDPDIIYTDGGDDFYLDYLAERARRSGLERFDLGRDKGLRLSKGKSYFTYGRIVYKPPAHKLKGRIHLDSGGSVTYARSGIYGLIDISRLSLISIQELARLSPGTAISAMQINQAVRDGHLVLWKKNLPEDFKTAGQLLRCDRGGFIHEPEVGIHSNVAEVDFVSLYPSIIVRHNISPETLMCTCCPESSKIVPGLGYRTCLSRTGLLPRVLAPVINRRLALKRLVKTLPHGLEREAMEERISLLKWILVTCFGYTGYRNARFGRIECHESINAYGREILLRTTEMAEERGLRVLHGIVDSLWLKGEGDVETFCQEVSNEIGIPLQLDGVFKWIVFLPRVRDEIGALNRYYGLFQDGELKLRGVFLRRSDTVELARDLQQGMLQVFRKAEDAQQFLQLIPQALEVLDAHLDRVRSGDAPLEKLVVRHRVAKELEEYSQLNDSYAALRQMQEMGFRVPPGRSVEYVILDGSSRDVWERVRAAPFLRGDERYDALEYEEMLLRAAADLLLPFGWDLEALRERSRGAR